MSGAEDIPDPRPTIEAYERLCHACRAGLPDECEASFGTESDCPSEGPTIDAYLRALTLLRMIQGLDGEIKPPSGSRKKKPAGEPESTPERVRGDSGYIHPDAWPSSSDIGTLTDPASTGRKRVAEMYPITVGLVCEWANKMDCGGGVEPIVGCMGNPASDIHHGPDKNTLNNAKRTRGISENEENVHLICSFCHNTWHARNNGYYPPYDRKEDQESPWLPAHAGPWGSQTMIDAPIEILIAEETRRREEHVRKGRKHNGRGGVSTVAPDAESGWDISELTD